MAGPRGATLGRAARLGGAPDSTAPAVGGGSGAAEVSGPDGAGRGDDPGDTTEVFSPADAGNGGGPGDMTDVLRVADAGRGGGRRSGGGGGALRAPLGMSVPGAMPRDDGAGGMRDTGAPPPPAGRGTTLTGRGITLTGAAGGTEAAGSDAEMALGSFSSPMSCRAKLACGRL